MKQGTIISAIIGGTFFGLAFLGLKLTFLPAIAFGIVGFVAGELFFSNDKKDYILEDLPDSVVIAEMKKINQNIYTMIAKVDNVELKSDIKNIYQTTNKIIEKVSKDKKSLKKIRTFINYYLPVTLKILVKYDEIENQHMNTKDGKEFMKTVEEKIKVIARAFENQLGALYQNDMVDVDAELGVLENMLKTEGYTDLEDFNLRERGKNNE